jgi:hypothetical protein
MSAIVVALVAVVILAVGLMFWKRKSGNDKAASNKPGEKGFGVQLKSGKNSDENYPIW